MFYLPQYKADLNVMLHYIQIFTNTYEVTMVKRVIGKGILNKLPIYYEDM